VGDEVILTITKQNYLRYEAVIEVMDVLVAGFSADATSTCVDQGVNFSDETIGTPVSWLWTFEGGTPETSTDQNPTGIIFENEGQYDVTLEVTSTYSTHSVTMTDYISSFEYAEASVLIETETLEVCEGEEVMFTAICENEGSSPNMTWTLNGTPVGDNNDTLFLTGLTDQDVVNCELTSSRPCLMQNPVASNELVMTVSAYVDVSVNIETETLEVCDGAETVFTAIPQNPGVDPVYTWMINGNVVGDNTATLVTTELTDQDVVTCELNSSEVCTNGNPATSNSLTMTVLESTSVSLTVDASATEICEGDEVTFTANPVNPGQNPTYQWKMNGEEVGDNSATYTASDLSDQDIVICEMVSSEFCPVPNPAVSNETTMAVTLLPAQAEIPQGPEQVDSYSTPSSEYTTESVQGATSYTWTITPDNAGSLDIQDNSCTVTWQDNFQGTVTINVAGTNDCGNGPVSGNYEVTVENSFGIEDYLGNIGIQVYPNPNRGNFYIEFSSPAAAKLEYKIINSVGEVVYSRQNIIVNGQYKETIDLSAFAEGMYFMMISNEDQTTHKRIIIQK
jgi:PKD repeat protein